MLNTIKDDLATFLLINQIDPLDPNIFSLFTPKQIGYRCAIAFQLSAKKGNSPQSWAKKINNTYQKQSNPTFNLIMQSDGYLDFFPYPITLATWLTAFPQHWQQISLNRVKIINYQSYKNFNPFFCQYAHARCCSLQRLVIQEQGKLKNNQIPWLFFLENPRLSEIQEWELLQRLIFICDRFNTASDKEVLRLGMALSESLFLFERYCQILGEVCRKIPQIAQVRLGLINNIAIILNDLLTNYLQLEAPTYL